MAAIYVAHRWSKVGRRDILGGRCPWKSTTRSFTLCSYNFYRQNYFLLFDRFDPFLSYMILQLFITLSCKFYLFLKHLLYKNMVVMMTSLWDSFKILQANVRVFEHSGFSVSGSLKFPDVDFTGARNSKICRYCFDPPEVRYKKNGSEWNE